MFHGRNILFALPDINDFHISPATENQTNSTPRIAQPTEITGKGTDTLPPLRLRRSRWRKCVRTWSSLNILALTYTLFT
ncbi:hypothetical protein ACLVWU_01725 [Bdellovibrio sp. HCB290]|uniref:hypothetical protein n=1 Tax=Bdellovibrio sp. HCB290 TaxID=3394356 RepID=UPI0039B617E8